jgi:two-component system phosphate regulon response regulator PhoB
MARVLIVEDETAIRELEAFICQTDGMTAVKTADLAQARQALAGETPDVILLDVMLPDGSGIDFLGELRAAGKRVPVIIVTARGDESDRVTGLDAGADDYIVKPFMPRELTARIRAVIRRAGGEAAEPASGDPETVRCGPLYMDSARFEASAGDRPLKLSVKEFRLLFVLARHPGRVYSRRQLLEAVWGNTFITERTVDVHMLRLRKALAGTPAEELVETVRGIGYRCRPIEEEEASA